MVDKQLDAKGLVCPLPIARIASALREMEPGQSLEVEANDPAFKADVESFCRVSGNELLSLSEEGGTTKAVLKKMASS